MDRSNFISAAVLDISRKATVVKEKADSIIDRLHYFSSGKLYCKCMLAVLLLLLMPCDCGSGVSHDNILLIEDNRVSP